MHALAVIFPFGQELSGGNRLNLRPGNGLREHERQEPRHAATLRLRPPAPEPGEQLRIGRCLPVPNLFDCANVHRAGRRQHLLDLARGHAGFERLQAD